MEKGSRPGEPPKMCGAVSAAAPGVTLSPALCTEQQRSRAHPTNTAPLLCPCGAGRARAHSAPPAVFMPNLPELSTAFFATALSQLFPTCVQSCQCLSTLLHSNSSQPVTAAGAGDGLCHLAADGTQAEPLTSALLPCTSQSWALPSLPQKSL